MASATGNGSTEVQPPNFAREVFHIITDITSNTSSTDNSTTTTAQAADNIAISPFLLEALLSLLYLGADGTTAEQLQRLLQLKRHASNAKMANYYAVMLELITGANDTRLEVCNKMILNENFTVAEEFEKIAHKYFHTTTTGKCDLKNAQKLRDEYATDTLSDEVGCLLCSTVNFKSKWFLPFSAYRSGTYEFHNSTGEPKAVPMLFDDDMFVKFAELREWDARAIELPYEHDDELAMLLVLPNQRGGLQALEAQLRQVDLAMLEERMQMESVQVLLPKFKINFACGLRACLEKLGFTTIFSKEANFKNLLREDCKMPLAIGEALHKVTIEVNESGSEVATSAANKPIVLSNSKDSRHKFFRADHPFYFAIRGQNITYLVGHVTKC